MGVRDESSVRYCSCLIVVFSLSDDCCRLFCAVHRAIVGCGNGGGVSVFVEEVVFR